MNKKECILSDQDLGIITENDHKLGLCLCNKCTCGNHICAVKTIFSTTPLKMNTTYKSNFQKMKPKVLLKMDMSQSPRIRRFFDGVSTYRLEFQPHECTPLPHIKNYFPIPAVGLGTIRSSYEKDYVDFHTEAAQSMSPMKNSLGLGNFKFSDSTTYKSNFFEKPLEKTNKTTSNLRSKMFLDPNGYLQTSHRRDFQDTSANELNSRIVVKTPAPVKIKGKVEQKKEHAEVYSPIKNIPRRLAALNQINK